MSKFKIPVVRDAYDGSRLAPHWVPEFMVHPGETRKAIKPSPHVHTTTGWKNDVWTGRYEGYGNDGTGTPLFRTMRNAVQFASAAYRAGFRIKKP